MTDDDDELSAIDKDALERALALSQAESPGRRVQIDRMLCEDEWFEAATFASFNCQCRSLGLRPWHPCR